MRVCDVEGGAVCSKIAHLAISAWNHVDPALAVSYPDYGSWYCQSCIEKGKLQQSEGFVLRLPSQTTIQNVLGKNMFIFVLV